MRETRLKTNKASTVIDIDVYYHKELKMYVMTINAIELTDRGGYITESYCPADSYRVGILEAKRQSMKRLEEAKKLMWSIYRPYAEAVAEAHDVKIVD